MYQKMEINRCKPRVFQEHFIKFVTFFSKLSKSAKTREKMSNKQMNE